ncbi:hypothetical protein CaCOL14_005984 [Colletotrichum acutatum]
MFIQIALPPSTSKLTPVMKLLSSETKNTEASTTSSISPSLCKGTFPMNF